MSEEKSGTVAQSVEQIPFKDEVEGSNPSSSTKIWKCTFCDEEFVNKEKFAGHRSGHVRKGDIPKKQPRKSDGICKVCGDCFPTKSMWAHVRRHNNYKTFDELSNYRAKKARLLEELGIICEVCAQTTWMGKPIPIEIDHIDGNSTNNTRENLRLICPNCHAQTSTYKGKNVGKNPDKKRAETLKKYQGKYR